MTDTELSAIRARCEAATPWPWIDSGEGKYDIDNNDLYFIAHARTDIPALLAHIEGLKLALGKSEADKAALVEHIEKQQKEINYAQRKGVAGLAWMEKDARAILARVKGEA